MFSLPKDNVQPHYYNQLFYQCKDVSHSSTAKSDTNWIANIVKEHAVKFSCYATVQWLYLTFSEKGNGRGFIKEREATVLWRRREKKKKKKKNLSLLTFETVINLRVLLLPLYTFIRECLVLIPLTLLHRTDVPYVVTKSLSGAEPTLPYVVMKF